MRRTAALAIPIVWEYCRLQVIDETGERPVWRTVGRCLWTPNAIKAAVARLAVRNIHRVWVDGPDGRVPTF